MREARWPSSRLLLTHRAVLPGILSADRHFERLAEQADRILLSILFDELVPHSWFCEKMASAFFKMSRSFCVLSKSRLSRRNSSRFRGLMSTARKRYLAMFGSFLAPLMDRRVRNAQLTSDLRNWLATRPGQLHCFALKLRRVGFLDFLHDPCPPFEIVYSKLFPFHKRGARSSTQM